MTQENFTLRLAQLSDARQIALMSRDLIESGLGWTWNLSGITLRILDI